MELQYFGANCVRITTKKANIIIDDNLAEVGLKSITKAGDIQLFTGKHADVSPDAGLVIDIPGEYEASDVSIMGIPARAHMDEEDKKNAVMYRIHVNDIRILVTGHIFADLSEAQLEAIGIVDVLFVPVGNHGYTLDGTGAAKVIRKIEPKIVIPTHYEDSAIKYEVPQEKLDVALKEIGMEPKETVPKLKIKEIDLAETTQLVVLERQ